MIIIIFIICFNNDYKYSKKLKRRDINSMHHLINIRKRLNKIIKLMINNNLMYKEEIRNINLSNREENY